MHDVNILDEILPEAWAIYVMDCAYIDFERLYVFTLSSAFFVVRPDSTDFERDPFWKTSILRALQPPDSEDIELDFANQLNLFTL